MKIEELIERAAIRGLIVTDDEKGVHVGYTFAPETVILSLDRAFFEQAQAKLIMSMVDDRLESTDENGPAYGTDPIVGIIKEIIDGIDNSVRNGPPLTITPFTNNPLIIMHPTQSWGEIVTPGYSAPPTGQYQKLRNAAGFLLRKSREGLTKIVQCSILLLFLCGIVAIKKRRKKHATTLTK